MISILECARLASAAYDDPRSIGGFHHIPIQGAPAFRKKSFAGSVFQNGRVRVVAFRGSMESTDWMHADRDIASGLLPKRVRDVLGLGSLPEQIGDAFSFFSTARKQQGEKPFSLMCVVGHSLGGALAAIVAARITTIPVIGVTFNAPGCKGFETAGRWVDDDSHALAESIDDLGKSIRDRSPMALLNAAKVRARVAPVVGNWIGERVFSGHRQPRLAIPSANTRNVHNVVAVSRSGAQDLVSSIMSGHIGDSDPIKVVVKTGLEASGGLATLAGRYTGAAAAGAIGAIGAVGTVESGLLHSMKPLITALESDPAGSRLLSCK